MLEEGTTWYIKDYQPPLPPGWKEENKQMNVAALMNVEIGGLNSMEPLILGAELGIPVLDADGMGRAFPELQVNNIILCFTGDFCYLEPMSSILYESIIFLDVLSIYLWD